jgi:hypothetical protein
MQAISFTAPRQVEIINIPEPRLGPEEVLVGIHFIGLCGTDLNSYLISKVYPFAQTTQAFSDWDADPGKFTKILIDLKTM